MTEWRDLSANRPGQGVHNQAVGAVQAAPVKRLIARLLGVRTAAGAWRAGAEGEREVGRQLRNLGRDWRVLRAVPVGRKDSDIDHVVIGPGGVFTLNTKNHGRSRAWVAENAFLVNGRRTDYLRKSRFEAERASRCLSAACGGHVAVEPVVVVMAATLRVKGAPAGVHVVSGKMITKWLARRPVVMEPARVDAIFEQARRDSTWRTAPRSPE